MDDLLAGGSSDEEHLRSLEAIFFKKFSLRVKLTKYVFMAPSMVYFRAALFRAWSSTGRRKGQGHQGGTNPS